MKPFQFASTLAVAFAATVATDHACFAGTQPNPPELAATGFVGGYSTALSVAPSSGVQGSAIHILARVDDFTLMGECLASGCASIDGAIHAAGKDVWFTCGGAKIIVTNLTAREFEQQQSPAAISEPASYEIWASSYPGADVAESWGDSDRDGISNLLEYGLGLDPSAADRKSIASVVPQTIGGVRFLTLSYKRDLSKADIVVEVQASTDLSEGSWGSAGVEDELVSKAGQIEQRCAMIRLSKGRGFLRLVVKQN